MMLKTPTLLIVFISCFSTTAIAGYADGHSQPYDADRPSKPFYNDAARGWNWYENPTAPEKKVKKKKPAVTQAAPVQTKPLTASQILKEQGKEWHEAMSEAVLHPTRKNLQRYLAMTQMIQAQAQTFSTAFKQAIWTMPQYDYTLKGRPVSGQAIEAQSQVINKRNSSDLYKIAKTKGIVYFFRSDCPFCERFSPIIKNFAEHYGFTVIPVSLDGKGNAQFPYPKHSDSMAKKFHVSVVPAYYLVDPEKNVVSVAGYGYASTTTLLSKILFADSQIDAAANKRIGEVNEN